MNIFNDIKKYNTQDRHKLYLERIGMTEEQYQKQQEEEKKAAEERHKKYLEENNLTEEQYQKKIQKEIKKKIRKDKAIEALKVVGFLGAIIAVIAIFSSDEGKEIIAYIGVILAFGFFLFLCIPVYYFLKEALGNNKSIFWNIIIAIASILIIALFVYLIGSSSCDNDMINDAHRPDRF